VTETHLRVERDPDGIGRIVLDRPEAKNALTIAMRDGIVDAVRDFRADPKVRAVLITAKVTRSVRGWISVHRRSRRRASPALLPAALPKRCVSACRR